MSRCATASPPRSVDDDAMTTVVVLLGDSACEDCNDVFVAAKDDVCIVHERDDDDLELDDDEYWLQQQIDDDLESIHLRELLLDDDNDDLVQRLLLDGDSENDVDQTVESEVESIAVRSRTRNAVRVTFGEVQVREYSVTLGNHPLCQQYPLTLDWAHTEATTYDDMDQYEAVCQLSNRKLQLDRDERVRRLVNVTGIDSSEWEEREEFRMLDLLEERENEIEHNDDDDDDDLDSDDSDDDQSLDLEEPGCDYEWSFNEVAAATSTATEATLERPRRRVSFGPVQVQEYKVIHGEGNCLALVDGYEHDEEHEWLRTEYPAKLNYPVTLDWSHSAVQEIDLDLHESTKSQVECRYLQPNERLQRLRDMSGMSAGVLEWKERQRIQREKQQWLSQVLVELETASDDDDYEKEEAVAEEAEVSTPSVNLSVTTASSSRRRQRPVRLTHSSSSKAAIVALVPPRRRSPRLASQARCSYRV